MLYSYINFSEKIYKIFKLLKSKLMTKQTRSSSTKKHTLEKLTKLKNFAIKR